MKAQLRLCSITFGIALLVFACAQKTPATTATGDADGAAIYKKYCKLCHGADGKLGLNGAKDLTVCTLSEAERIQLIKVGKNAMTPFDGILSEEEIKAVAAYTMTLK